ncbi:MAG: cytochrome c [Blastocatellia bacterium]
MKKRFFLTTLSALFFCLMFADSQSSSASVERGAGLTFTKDIAPIIYKNCSSCHRQGEIAPMSLVDYKEIRPWAKAIREKVITREMPPWHPDPGFGHWSNDRRMSQKEIDTLVAWVDSGAKEGNPKDLPPMPKFSSGWQIGEPDVIFRMPEEFTVPAEGAIAYQYFRVPTNFKEDRYIHAMEARAGNLSVVHHIVVYVREPGYKQPKKLDLGDGLLGALSPGQTPFVAQPGTAKLIKAGSELIFQLHYTPNGKEATDRSYIGLIFAKDPVQKMIVTTAAFDTRFTIPPGAQNHEIKASYEFEQDAEIISLMPHMHLRGKDITYKAIYTDGRTETLLYIPRYDFSWQVYYYPKQSLRMPKGTRIEVVAHYDNSTRNALNPDPTKAVRFGEQTWDEMMNGFFDYTVAAPKSGDKSK